MPESSQLPYVLLMPAWNDWTSAAELIRRIDNVADQSLDQPLTVVIVDDGSSEQATGDNDPLGQAYRAIERLDIVRLRCNLGHQRAIAVGLCYIEKNLPHTAVIVMDSDGEDDPAEIPNLIDTFERLDKAPVVLAKRSQRTEGPVFAVCYWAYRKLFRLLAGIKVRSGNYCLVGSSHVRTLIAGSDLWNHFGATIFRMRLDTVQLPTSRQPRIDGQSKVGFVGLIVHGLSAVSVFVDRACVRVMLGSVVLAALGALGLVVNLLTGLNGQASRLWVLAAVLAMLAVLFGVQLFLGATVTLFMSLRLRDSASVVPARVFEFFIDTHRTKQFDADGVQDARSM